MDTVVPTETTMCSWTVELKPAASAVRLYTPAGRLRMLNSPESLELAVWTTPVASFRRVILTLGTAARWAS